MKRPVASTILFVVSVIAAMNGHANADTLPPGATAISGSVPVIVAGGDGTATLPIKVPERQVFVLTDIEVGFFLLALEVYIFGEDPSAPRFQGVAHGSYFPSSSTGTFSYERFFQTGLVFSAAPTITVRQCGIGGCGAGRTRVSFSGYFITAP